jgi:hypothetical protein
MHCSRGCAGRDGTANAYLALLLLVPVLPLGFITAGERSVLSQLGGTTVSGMVLVVSVPLMALVLTARRQLPCGLRAFAIPVSWVGGLLSRLSTLLG